MARPVKQLRVSGVCLTKIVDTSEEDLADVQVGEEATRSRRSFGMISFEGQGFDVRPLSERPLS